MKARIAIVFAAFCVLFAAPAFAQEPNDAPDAEDSSAEDRASAFRAVSGPQVDRVPGGALLVSAYGIAWVMVVLFIARIGGVQRRARGELEALQKALEER